MRAPTLHEQFADLDKQAHAVRLGMWLFLGSESMLFAGLFTLYAAYRAMYPIEVAAAVAHQNIALGTANTFVLLTASLMAMLGEVWVQRGRLRPAAALFLVAAALGVLFLFVKGVEYGQHFHEGIFPGALYRFPDLPGHGANMLFTLYFALTFLHALHLIAGIGLLAFIASGCFRGLYSSARRSHVENAVLYFHLVDVVWLFLWPLFYLAGP